MENNEPKEELVENKENVDTQATENKDEEKKFTQEEVNSFLRKERLKIFKNDDEEKLYKEWKESKKTSEEKYAEMSSMLEKANETSLKKDHLIEVIDSGVDKEFREFVASKVESMDGDFSKNLKTYLKDNTRFLKENTIKTISTSPKMNGTTNNLNSTNESMNELIRSMRK